MYILTYIRVPTNVVIKVQAYIVVVVNLEPNAS